MKKILIPILIATLACCNNVETKNMTEKQFGRELLKATKQNDHNIFKDLMPEKPKGFSFEQMILKTQNSSPLYIAIQKIHKSSHIFSICLNRN